MAIDLADITAGDGSLGFVLQGESFYDTSGYSVASAGDVNGDGFDDLIVGAPQADGPLDGRGSAGDSYVIFGKAGGFGGTVDLATITAGDGSLGFVLQGELAGDKSGRSVASAGDINGDGFDDLIVGAYAAGGPVDGRSYAGDSYVIFGKAGGFGGTVDLATITAGDGSVGFVLQGELAGDRSGWSVASAGDVNGDGFDDLIVGAPFAAGPADGRSEAGDSYVIFGKAGGFGVAVDLATITAGDGSQGFVVQGELADDRSGWSVASGGDVNGDGYDDLIVGAFTADGPSDGRNYAGDSYVIFGTAAGFGATVDLADITSGDGSLGFVLQGELASDRSGTSVASAGDIDGDGFDDLIVGAVRADGPLDGRSDAGDSYVIFGKAGGFGGTVDLAAITAGDGSLGFVLQGELANDQSGYSVASAGDVNGDGFDDMIVGAGLADGPADGRIIAGDSYVIFGKAGGFGTTVDLADITAGTGGFVIHGELAIDRSGTSVASAGDIDGDGFDDLIIGARAADGPGDGDSAAGDSYVIFGSATIGGSADAVTHAGTGAGETLNGSAGANVMVGGRGDDTLEGNGGADVLQGGEGDDTLAIGDADFFRLVGGTGHDVLALGGAMTLGDEHFRRIDGVEGIALGDFATDLTLGRIAALALKGLAVDGFRLVIDGSAVADAAITLDGTGLGRALTVDLSGNAAASTLFGGAGGDEFTGGAGNDLLDGGAGADTMIGGTGDDSYFVDDVGDLVTEDAGEGATDRVKTTLSIHALAAEVERLNFIGTGNFTGAGNGLANQLTGGTGDDTLTGLGDNDQLNGRAGADTMIGGTGDDSYFVDDAGDLVTEDAGEGTADRVKTTLSIHALAAEVERLNFIGTGNFTGTGNGLANQLTGGTGDDTLTGLGDNDMLNGRAGADTMIGGTGDDSYFVDDGGDVVTEDSGEGTADRVKTTLSSYTLAAEVERLTFTGIGNFAGTGNGLDNQLTGGTGDDTLNGGGGRDWLAGGAGADTFVFDSPLLAANRTIVADFTAGTDTIALSSAIFTDAGPTGPLATAAFFIGSAAHDGDDRIIYNSADGHLLYDADGTGAQAAVTFGRMTPGLSMTESDFRIV